MPSELNRPRAPCRARFIRPGNNQPSAPTQGYGTINLEENTTNNTYNGLQASLRLQNKWGLSGELDYTYSHTIDLTDGDLNTGGIGQGTGNGIQNPYNLKYDKASGGYDRRQIFGGNYIYALPIFNKSAGLVHSLLGGWQIAGTFVDETGEPAPSQMGGVTDRRSPRLGGGGSFGSFANIQATRSALPSQSRQLVRHLRQRRTWDRLLQIRRRHRPPAMPVVLTLASVTDGATPSSARDVSISQRLSTRTFAITERAHFRVPRGSRTTRSTTPSCKTSTRRGLTRPAANMERRLAIGVHVSCSLAPS